MSKNTKYKYKLQNTTYKIVHLIWKYLPNIALAGPVLHVEDPSLLLPITHLDLPQSLTPLLVKLDRNLTSHKRLWQSILLLHFLLILLRHAYR